MNRQWMIGAVAVVLVFLWRLRRGMPTETLEDSGRRPTEADIDALIRSGRKIEAIKAYRRLHQADLKTAKDTIDARERALIQSGPPKPIQ